MAESELVTPAPQPEPKPEPKPLNPRARRANMYLTIDIGNGETVKARRLSLDLMMFSGLLPLPLLAAVQRMMANPVAEKNPLAQLLAVSDEQKEAMLVMLRKHAVAAVVEPVVTATDDGNPDHLPVDLLSIEALTKIWQETSIIPLASDDAVSRFRRRATRTC
jgi:DNA-binding FrmR family transcriptional regulator